MEMLLMGMTGCSTYDVIHILKKGRADVRDCVVEVDAERAPVDPKVFTKIHLHFIVTGRGLKTETVERAIKLSAEKYCSASIMLGQVVPITHDFEVKEAD
jgi:putative redox protein